MKKIFSESQRENQSHTKIGLGCGHTTRPSQPNSQALLADLRRMCYCRHTCHPRPKYISDIPTDFRKQPIAQPNNFMEIRAMNRKQNPDELRRNYMIFTGSLYPMNQALKIGYIQEVLRIQVVRLTNAGGSEDQLSSVTVTRSYRSCPSSCKNEQIHQAWGYFKTLRKPCILHNLH